MESENVSEKILTDTHGKFPFASYPSGHAMITKQSEKYEPKGVQDRPRALYASIS